jgi:DUF1009 family protein
MKIGIIAGNRRLPILLAKSIKDQFADSEITAICIHKETSSQIKRYVDKTFWFNIGQLRKVKEAIQQSNTRDWVMAGQINPLRIFRQESWDEDLTALMKDIKDIRPHTVFDRIILYLEEAGVSFLDSTRYLQNSLASSGIMNGLSLTDKMREDIDFGVRIISRFVELDVGQTMAVKSKSVTALESLEGTDNTIRRAFSLAGKGCTILKFSKSSQDLRFDVPVVGLSTLKLLKKICAGGLILETGKVLILDKEEFLSSSNKWGIPIIGSNKTS